MAKTVQVSGLVRAKDRHRVQKRWGREEWIANTNKYCGKLLIVNKSRQGSLHYHRLKTETFYILSGKILLELDGKTAVYYPGDSIDIEPGQVHRYGGLKRSVVIEFSTEHSDEDTYRKELDRKMPEKLLQRYGNA